MPAHAVPPGTLSAHHTADTSHLRTSPLPLLHNPETPGSISQNLPRYGAGRDYSVFSYILSFLFRPAGSLSITWAPPPDDSEHSAPLPHCGCKYCVHVQRQPAESYHRSLSAGRRLLPGYMECYVLPLLPDIRQHFFRTPLKNGWDAGSAPHPLSAGTDWSAVPRRMGYYDSHTPGAVHSHWPRYGSAIAEGLP